MLGKKWGDCPKELKNDFIAYGSLVCSVDGSFYLCHKGLAIVLGSENYSYSTFVDDDSVLIDFYSLILE